MKGCVKLELIGLNQVKLLNAFAAKGIAVKELSKASQKSMTIWIPLSRKAEAVELSEKHGFECSVKEERSAKKAFLGLLPRCGLIVGIISMIVVSIIVSRFVWKIEISGNDRVDELTILRTLKQNGISVGREKNFDRRSVEDALLALDEISAVSAEIVGTTLKVNVVESAVVTPSKQKGDIISIYDAEVTRIVVGSGTAKVKIGDRVPMGKVLIEGAEYDTEGNPLFCTDAQGDIFGKVNFTYTEVATTSGGYVRTGKVQKNTVIKFFGLNIGKTKEPDGKFEAQKTVTRLFSIFPLYAETTEYYELEKAEISLEELTRKTVDKAVSTLIIRAGGSAVSTTFSAVEVAENIYKITVHIEAEVSIGGKRID